MKLIPIVGTKFYAKDSEILEYIRNSSLNRFSLIKVSMGSLILSTEHNGKRIGSFGTNKFQQKKSLFMNKGRFKEEDFLSKEQAEKIEGIYKISYFDPENSIIVASLIEENDILYYNGFERSIDPKSELTDNFNVVSTNIFNTSLTNALDKKPANAAEKENKNMNLNLETMGIKFGKVTGNQFKISMNGIAVKGQGTNDYFVWDAKSSTLVNVNSLVFDFDMLYYMPSKDVKIGDTILHNGGAVSVTTVEKGTVTGVRYSDQTIVTIPAMKNIFGFNFYTKVTSLMDLGGDGGGFADMFGNKDGFNPMMLMLLGGNTGNGNSTNGALGGDFMQMMLLSQLGGSGLFGGKSKTEDKE